MSQWFMWVLVTAMLFSLGWQSYLMNERKTKWQIEHIFTAVHFEQKARNYKKQKKNSIYILCRDDYILIITWHSICYWQADNLLLPHSSANSIHFVGSTLANGSDLHFPTSSFQAGLVQQWRQSSNVIITQTFSIWIHHASRIYGRPESAVIVPVLFIRPYDVQWKWPEEMRSWNGRLWCCCHILGHFLLGRGGCWRESVLLYGSEPSAQIATKGNWTLFLHHSWALNYSQLVIYCNSHIWKALVASYNLSGVARQTVNDLH